MDTQNVTAGKPKIGGAIFTAPLGSKVPTDATSKLSNSYKNLGYISQDGIVNNNTAETEVVKAWGGDTVLVIQTEKPDEFTYKLIEVLNVDVLKEVYGAHNVQGTLDTGIKITVNSDEARPHILVIDMVLQNALKRIVIPNGVVKEIGEISYNDEDAVGYEITLEALPDASGNNHYEYIQKADTVSTTTSSTGGV